MTLCNANMIFVILTSYTVLLNGGANADELLMQTVSKVLLLDTRMDNMEIKLENSLTDLQTQLAEGLERIAETQRNCEPKQGGITKSIQSTIPNTVTQMVKSQYIAISTAMKREKVALLSLNTEVKNHMKAIGDDFQNLQRNVEGRFMNQSISNEEQIRTQKEHVSDVMKDVIIETNAYANQIEIDLKKTLTSLDQRVSNKTKALDYKFERQSNDISKHISNARNEREQLKGNFGDAQKLIGKRIDDFKEEMNERTVNLETTLNLRISNQENRISSLNSRMSISEGNLLSYKSSCDSLKSDVISVASRVSSIENVLAVDGQWNEWVEWTNCITQCQSGEQVRTRECNNPSPLFGGANCVGGRIEIRDNPYTSWIRNLHIGGKMRLHYDV